LKTLSAEALEALATTGFVQQPAFLDAATLAALREEAGGPASQEGMHRAGIGRGAEHQVAEAVRGDWIRWLDGRTEAQRRLLERWEALRVEVNRELMLGLFELEAHFALYPPGAGYARHLDAFRADNPRRLSAVLYLNPDWRAEDGGELVVYDASGGERLRVLPEAGTLALFLSQEIEHAVLPTRRWRSSIAGWFRVRS
jgi:SM-20-related protein